MVGRPCVFNTLTDKKNTFEKYRIDAVSLLARAFVEKAPSCFKFLFKCFEPSSEDLKAKNMN
jgi:hypothetical protein